MADFDNSEEAKKRFDDLKLIQKGVDAGMHLSFDARRLVRTPIQPINIGWALGKDDLKVPHSELARHTGIAGNDIVTFVTDGREGCVVSVDKDGNTKTSCGLVSEVMKRDLLDHSKFLWERGV